MTVYIGLDLAWSARNRTGIAALIGDTSGATLHEIALLRSDAEILDFIIANVETEPAIVGVDAPLQVPNETSLRPAERELAAVFRRYEAGPHPANRHLLARNGVVRGEWLIAALAEHGFEYEPLIAPVGPPRQVSEIFPHPASIALFGLQRTLKYKARPGRTMAERYAAFQDYQNHLRALAFADPPLRGHDALLDIDVTRLSGVALKGYEDQIDALFCAYIALYGQRWGAARCRVFGDRTSGAIFTPMPEPYWERGN